MYLFLERYREGQERTIFYIMEGHLEGSYILEVSVIRKVKRRSGAQYIYYITEGHVRECDITLASVIRKVDSRPGGEHFLPYAGSHWTDWEFTGKAAADHHGGTNTEPSTRLTF